MQILGRYKGRVVVDRRTDMAIDEAGAARHGLCRRSA
jgi:hypothetical protein